MWSFFVSSPEDAAQNTVFIVSLICTAFGAGRFSAEGPGRGGFFIFEKSA
jgi:hypothetical protein